jgi:transglutaminase-like putative cysteine protease
MAWARSIAVAALAGLASAAAAQAPAKGRSGTVTFLIEVAAPAGAKDVKLWFPYPTSDLEQTIEGLRFEGNYGAFSLSREPQSGALYLFTRWSAPIESHRLAVTFRAHAQERRVARPVESTGPIPPEVRRYLEAEFWIPSDDAGVRRLAAEIVGRRSGILARARSIYDWVLANTRRDPNVPGCGFGKVEATLASRAGKCADLSSVFVALARAAGVPAREVFGLRLGLPGERDVTDGHHCWAEFYLPGTGWVPVDPADVLKQLGEKDARGLDATAAQRLRDYYFGAVDEYRIVLQRGGRGLSFPEGNARKVNYFMYPYAEVDGLPLDYCRPRTFAYTIRFDEG